MGAIDREASSIMDLYVNDWSTVLELDFLGQDCSDLVILSFINWCYGQQAS